MDTFLITWKIFNMRCWKFYTTLFYLWLIGYKIGQIKNFLFIDAKSSFHECFSVSIVYIIQSFNKMKMLRVTSDSQVEIDYSGIGFSNGLSNSVGYHNFHSHIEAKNRFHYL